MTPAHPDLIQAFAQTLFSPGAMTTIAVVTALLHWLGQASLRLLETAPPDLPHLSAMRAGARRLWLGFLVAVLTMLGLLFATAFTPLPLTLSGLVLAASLLLFLLLPRLQWPVVGLMLWVLLHTARRRGEPTDLPSLLAGQEVKERRARKYLSLAALLLLAFWAWFIWRHAYPYDRYLQTLPPAGPPAVTEPAPDAGSYPGV